MTDHVDVDDPLCQMRAIRLVLATLDGDEDRADAVLEEEGFSPRGCALAKSNATTIVEQLEAESTRDTIRAALERVLLTMYGELEEQRDPIGWYWWASKFTD